MNTKDWKQKELNRLLMEKFNLSSPELEEEVEIDESHCGNRDEEELEEGEIKNPGKYKTGMEAGYDEDGDGIPNGADPDPKDGSKP